MKVSPKIVAPILYWVYRMWCKTLRITVEGRDAVDALEKSGTPMMFGLWHDEIFPIIYLKKTLKIVTIVSQSNDGEYLARILDFLGFKTARGSSSRGGIKALLQVSKLMQTETYNGCISLDGPRGPRHKAKEGAAFLAIKTPAPIVGVRMFAKHAIRFNSWDKFQLPLPFSRVYVEFSAPYYPNSQEISQETLQTETALLEQTLNNMQPPSDLLDPKNTVTYKVLKTITNGLQKLPLKTLHTIGSIFGTLFWLCAWSRKKMAIRSVQQHLNVSEGEAKTIAKNSFCNSFQSFLEIFYTKWLHEHPEHIKLGNSPGLQSFINETAPIIVVSAHMGSWELLGPYAAAGQPNKERAVVVRGNKNKSINAIMQELRTTGGITAIDHRNATKKATECLRKNGLVGFLVDHNTSRKEAIFLPFLGELAAVNQGPALLAIRTKAKVYPTCLIRNAQGELDVYVDIPLDTTTLEGSISERVKIIAEYYTRAVENFVLKQPDQWFWMHKRWKTRPLDEE